MKVGTKSSGSNEANASYRHCELKGEEFLWNVATLVYSVGTETKTGVRLIYIKDLSKILHK